MLLVPVASRQKQRLFYKPRGLVYPMSAKGGRHQLNRTEYGRVGAGAVSSFSRVNST